MGVWSWIVAAGDTFKQNVPDTKPIKEVCWNSVDFGRTAKTKVDRSVKSQALKFYQYLSDDQFRDEIGNFSKNVAWNGSLYLIRSYGAGPIVDVVSRSWTGQPKADPLKARVDALEAELKQLKAKLNHANNLDRVEFQRRNMSSANELGSNVNTNLKPEDVLRVFMMKEFIGNTLFDGLVVPITGSTKKINPYAEAAELDK